MSKILLIAQHFPPAAGGGVQRPAKLAKYLARRGHEVRVLTTHPRHVRDPEQVIEIEREPNISVHRIRWDVGAKTQSVLQKTRLARIYKTITQWILLGDGGSWNLPELIETGVRIGRGVDVIIATSLPFSSAIAGSQISRRLGCPWIADLRDPWAYAPRQIPATARHRDVQKQVEAIFLPMADKIVIMTETTRGYLPPAVRPGALVIPNGYDPEDLLVEPEAKAAGKFRIVYAGSLYGPRSPDHMLEAIERLSEHRDVELVLAGNAYGFEQRFKQSRANIIERGYLGHADTVRLVKSADAIMVLVGLGPSEDQPVPAKIYEAAAAGPPVICWARETSEAAKAIRNTSCGAVVQTADGIYDALSNIETIARPLEERADGLKPYLRQEIALRYEELIGELVASG